jgi:glycosyltransferase involved in cell wall biosynthesis
VSRIAIGICTYRRPGGLSLALSSLERLELRLSDDLVTVVVVDNAPDGSARELCALRAKTSRFALGYVNETRKGLSNARNAAIAEARRAGATYLAFIDDDEMAEQAWLQALFDTIRRTGCVAAAGPTYPLFAAPPNRWLPVESYAYAPLQSQGFVNDASSANMMLDLEKLQRLGLAFDPAFNETGGEDTHLIARLLSGSEKIAWSGTAIVWDSIPPERMRVTWLFRRWFRTGTTEARLGGPAAWTLRGRATNIAKGLARLGYGSVRIVFGMARAVSGAPQQLVASCYTACRGAGYLAGAVGHSFQEYAGRRYR